MLLHLIITPFRLATHFRPIKIIISDDGNDFPTGCACWELIEFISTRQYIRRPCGTVRSNIIKGDGVRKSNPIIQNKTSPYCRYFLEVTYIFYPNGKIICPIELSIKCQPCKGGYIVRNGI